MLAWVTQSLQVMELPTSPKIKMELNRHQKDVET